jgi:hypothetical protein
MIDLRQRVAEFMVRVHRIAPDLAEMHALSMDAEELEFRLQRYTEMELSAVSEQNQSSPRLSLPGFDACNDSCTPAALSPVSERFSDESPGGVRGCAKARHA